MNLNDAVHRLYFLCLSTSTKTPYLNKKGKMRNTEFKHNVDVFLYADFNNRQYFDILKLIRKLDFVILEQVGQTNTDYIGMVASLKRVFNFKVIASGDRMQCDPPLEDGQVQADVFNNKHNQEITKVICCITQSFVDSHKTCATLSVQLNQHMRFLIPQLPNISH